MWPHSHRCKENTAEGSVRSPGGPSVEGEGGRHMLAHFYDLGSASQEIEDPPAQERLQSKVAQLIDQSGRGNSIKH